MSEAPKSAVGPLTSHTLLMRLQGAADDDAWHDFYEVYWRVMYGYARYFGMDHADANDIVQETMIVAFRALPNFAYNRAKGRFLSWIKTITRNKIIDHVRRRNTAANRIAEHGEELPAHMPDDAPDPWYDEWRNSILARALERVRPKLKEGTYEAFRLYALENRPVDEVAKRLDMSANAIYVAKNRVLELLKKEATRLQLELDSDEAGAP